MFKDRILLIATKHLKERVIAPLVLKHLNIKDLLISNLDTDLLGTFSGEIEREDDPITTLRKKCLMALEHYDMDLGIATEGSFGPHPQLFFSYAHEELIVFIDKKNNVEIIERILSTETNFNSMEIEHESELLVFAESVNFPSHALILRHSKNETTDMVKGITDYDLLKQTFQHLKSKYTKVLVETDMRAMFNPTRMKVIEQLTEKLIQRILTTCPKCHFYGFGIESATPGLPCGLCGLPTKSILSFNYSCLKCDCKEVKLYPKNKQKEDPTYCDFCNP